MQPTDVAFWTCWIKLLFPKRSTDTIDWTEFMLLKGTVMFTYFFALKEFLNLSWLHPAWALSYCWSMSEERKLLAPDNQTGFLQGPNVDVLKYPCYMLLWHEPLKHVSLFLNKPSFETFREETRTTNTVFAHYYPDLRKKAQSQSTL